MSAIQQVLSSYQEAAPPAGIALISSVATPGPAQTGVTSGAIDTTGASDIIIGLGHYIFSGVPAVTDSEGNTWALIATYGSGGNSAIDLYRCHNPVTDAAHTFSAADASLYGSIAVMAFSGTSADAVEDEAGDTAAGVTVLQTGSVTPSENGALLVTALCSGNAQHDSASVDSGFSVPIEGVAAGDVYNVAMAYLVQDPAAAINPEWTVPDATGLSAIIAILLPA